MLRVGKWSQCSGSAKTTKDKAGVGVEECTSCEKNNSSKNREPGIEDEREEGATFDILTWCGKGAKDQAVWWKGVLSLWCW